MNSAAMASYRAAAPPEMFGEPGDEPVCRQPKCNRCGRFVSWKSEKSAPRESWLGEIVVEVVVGPCACGGCAFVTEDRVGFVYGPLPPWSDPHITWNAERGEWEDYLAQEAREWDREREINGDYDHAAAAAAQDREEPFDADWNHWTDHLP